MEGEGGIDSCSNSEMWEVVWALNVDEEKGDCVLVVLDREEGIVGWRDGWGICALEWKEGHVGGVGGGKKGWRCKRDAWIIGMQNKWGKISGQHEIPKLWVLLRKNW